MKFIRLVSLFFKNSVEKERSFYDKHPCILYVHDLTRRSIIKGLKGKLKLEV